MLTVSDQRRHRRWRTGRELRAVRDKKTHQDIRRVKVTLASWVLLMAASGVTAGVQIMTM